MTPRYPLVIFDMDGTLTRELMDYTTIRRQIAVPEGHGILEHISHLPPSEKSRAESILHQHEIATANTCTLHHGAAELLATLRATPPIPIKIALLTRNSALCAATVLARHRLTFDHVSSREDLPHKPHAESILKICRRLQQKPEQTLMVGDYLYDLQAAASAGAHSALIHHPPGDLPPFAPMATHVVRSLPELTKIILEERVNG